MKFEAKIHTIGALMEGISAMSGKPWVSREVEFSVKDNQPEFADQAHHKLVVKFIGDCARDFDSLAPGEEVILTLGFTTRTFGDNNRIFNSVNGWGVERKL